MSLLGASKVLGLAIGEKSILAAEVRVARGRRTLSRTAEFPLGDAAWAAKPGAALGDALRRFLRQKRFSASRVVVGLPARWLMARSRDLPPASPSLAASTLRLQAERLFPPELKELVFDYAGAPDAGKPTRVLLLATPREQLQWVTELADAAGLSLLAVTGSSMVLASETAVGADSRLVLAMSGGATEMVLHSAGQPQLLKHLPGIPPSSEIQRAMALMPSDVTSPREMMLWDGVAGDDQAMAALRRDLGQDLRTARDLSALKLEAEGQGNVVRYAAAAALALVGHERQRLPVDFLHSRLAPPRKKRIDRRTGILIAAILAVAAGVTWLIVDVQRLASQIDDLKKQHVANEPAVKAADDMAEKVNFAHGWFKEDRPPLLQAMLEVTRQFPEEGAIWATSLRFAETTKPTPGGRSVETKHIVTLQGRATEPRYIEALRDRISKDKRFSDVTPPDMREAGGTSKDWTFTLSFTFNDTTKPEAKAQPKPEAKP